MIYHNIDMIPLKLMFCLLHCRPALLLYVCIMEEEKSMFSKVTCDRLYRRTDSLLLLILSSQRTVFTFLA